MTEHDEPVIVWSLEVMDIYNRYAGRVDLHFGPSHIVFEDDNFLDRHIDSCIANCDNPPQYLRKWKPENLQLVKQALLEVRAIPEANRTCRAESWFPDSRYIPEKTKLYIQLENGDVELRHGKH